MGTQETRDAAQGRSQGTPSAQQTPHASWRHDLRSGVTEYSGELCSWLGFSGPDSLGLDPLLRAIPVQDRVFVEELLHARNPGFRSLSHPLESIHGRRLVQHHIGFDSDHQHVTGALLDISLRADMDSALALLACMVSADDDEFYRSCVRHLSEIYGVRFAFIALIDAEKSTATTVAVWAGDRHVENFTYELEGTPCEEVMNLQKEFIPSRAAELYPRDKLLVDMGVDSYFGSPLYDPHGKVFGIVSVMDTESMELPSWTAPILGVFSSRVSVEILRMKERQAAQQREQQLTQERERAQRFEALGRLGGSVAHDFQNLLTAILMNVEALQDLELDPRAEQHLEEILEAGEHARTLSTRLLTFGRKQEIAPKRIDVNATIRNQSALLQRLAGEHIRLDLNLAGGPLHTLFDPGEFEQILLNLVINARDAMPHGGRIVVETEPSDDWVSVRVSDDGHGIPEDIRHRIFEPNFTTKEDRGTGLGLATVFNILQGVGGRIEVQSVVGSGTTMSLKLLHQPDG